MCDWVLEPSATMTPRECFIFLSVHVRSARVSFLKSFSQYGSFNSDCKHWNLCFSFSSHNEFGKKTTRKITVNIISTKLTRLIKEADSFVGSENITQCIKCII